MKRSEWCPKFKVGDYAMIEYVPHHSNFFHDDEVRVIEVDGRKRARDPRPNRYKVRTIGRLGEQVEGWLYEDDIKRY